MMWPTMRWAAAVLMDARELMRMQEAWETIDSICRGEGGRGRTNWTPTRQTPPGAPSIQLRQP